jgi:membrane protein implicated in regulation of membrane protease activity
MERIIWGQAPLSPWFWFALAVVCGVIELASSFNLTTIWFALSALITALLAALIGDALSVEAQTRLYIAVFLVLGVALLVLTRPFAVKVLKIGRVKTNVDALAGQLAIITKKIPRAGRGEARINGQIWTVIAENGGEIDKDTECVVVRIEGVKALLKIKEN